MPTWIVDAGPVTVVLVVLDEVVVLVTVLVRVLVLVVVFTGATPTERTPFIPAAACPSRVQT
jgi:hypothetical protein